MTERAIYTLTGVLILIGTEILRWLAQAPPELCTVLTSLGGMLMAGGPSLLHPPDQRGSARVGVMLVVGGIAAFVALAWSVGACGSREILTRDPIAIEYWEGPPCRVVIHAGDEEPYIVRNPAGSGLRCVVAPSGGQ